MWVKNKEEGCKLMSSYFIYYTEASIVCVIIFGIMLCWDLFSIDKQEKQIKYDHALIAFMLYFVSDALWAAVIAGMLPRNRFIVVSTNFSNCVLMAAITYTWLRYVMAVEQREKARLAGRPVVGGLVTGGADVVGGETQEGFGDVAHDVAFMVALRKKRTEK